MIDQVCRHLTRRNYFEPAGCRFISRLLLEVEAVRISLYFPPNGPIPRRLYLTYIITVIPFTDRSRIVFISHPPLGHRVEKNTSVSSFLPASFAKPVDTHALARASPLRQSVTQINGMILHHSTIYFHNGRRSFSSRTIISPRCSDVCSSAQALRPVV